MTTEMTADEIVLQVSTRLAEKNPKATAEDIDNAVRAEYAELEAVRPARTQS